MKVLFISLGCDKNLSDSEHMLGLIARHGHEIVDDEAIAEAIIINTCCFIHDARQESVDTILEMAEYRKNGPCRALIVTGCLAQQYQNEIMEELPEVDACLGTASYDKILEALSQAEKGCRYQMYADTSSPVPDIGERLITTGGAVGYLKIAEGCDKRCSYCIIPSLRGSYRSVPMERLVAEAENMASQGVKELILVAQETTLYGRDIYGKKSLPRLLHALCRIDGIRWIRILYGYPEEIDDELITCMQEEEKICHYLDIPIQHGSDRILKLMGRRTSKQALIDLIGKLRSAMPDITLRTTLITGFPTETEEEHRELMDFVRDMAFDRLGVFTYSQEEGTKAGEMDGQIPEDVKNARRDELMSLQQTITAKKGRSFVGKELSVMIEGRLPEEGVYIGRSYRDAPKVDGYVFVDAEDELMTGDFVNVRITGSMAYDLTGEKIYTSYT